MSSVFVSFFMCICNFRYFPQFSSDDLWFLNIDIRITLLFFVYFSQCEESPRFFANKKSPPLDKWVFYLLRDKMGILTPAAQAQDDSFISLPTDRR